MQQNDMSETRRILVDGEELPGLVNVAEAPLSRDTIEVPETLKTRMISNGVTSIPAVELTYKTARNTRTRDFLKSWFENREVHDVTMVFQDGHGNEFDRQIWQDVELASYTPPAYDASSPTYAQVTVNAVPWDIIHVA